MENKFTCPLCGKPLSEHEYLSITGRWDHLRKLETDFRKKLHDEVQCARKHEREKVSHDIIVLKGQLVRARESCETHSAELSKASLPSLKVCSTRRSSPSNWAGGSAMTASFPLERAGM